MTQQLTIFSANDLSHKSINKAAEDKIMTNIEVTSKSSSTESTWTSRSPTI